MGFSKKELLHCGYDRVVGHRHSMWIAACFTDGSAVFVPKKHVFCMERKNLL